MTTHTAEDFRNSRFATHPDGGIAARLDPTDSEPWATSGATSWLWVSDAFMARNGWSPLDETRPEVIQHEFTITGRMDPDDVARAIQRQMGKPADLHVAIDEVIGETRGDEDARHQNHLAELRAMEMSTYLHLTAQVDQAKSFAALWKETARYQLAKIADRDDAHASCEWDRLEAVHRAEKAEAEMHRRGTRIIELEGDLDAMRGRAEGAEAERDEAVERADEAETMRDVAYSLNRSWQNLTPREHLEKAWEAAHAPEDGTIPAGAEHLVRFPEGQVRVREGERLAIAAAPEYGPERRLLDPPAPQRPDGAEGVQALIDEWADSWGCASDPSEDGNHGPLADFLAERGVRVTEDGAS